MGDQIVPGISDCN